MFNRSRVMNDVYKDASKIPATGKFCTHQEALTLMRNMEKVRGAFMRNEHF